MNGKKKRPELRTEQSAYVKQRQCDSSLGTGLRARAGCLSIFSLSCLPTLRSEQDYFMGPRIFFTPEVQQTADGWWIILRSLYKQ